MGKLKDFFEAVVGFAAGSTLVGLVIGSVGTTFSAIKTAFIGAVQQNLIYFGLSYITSKGSEDTAQRNLGIKRAVTNPVAPRNVIYGKTRVGGTIVQRTVSSKTGSTSQNVLHNVIAVAGHEINNITKVFMDAGKGTVELDLSSDFTSATENSTTVFRCTNSAFVNADNTDAYTSGSLVKLAFEKGDQTAANGYAVAQIPSGSWSTDHKLLGIAYVYINCIYDTKKFTAIPTFSFEVEGKKVFDPVSSSTVYSTNPALIIRDYLMDSTYGFGAVADEINDAASGAGFVQARSDCNDSVSITGGTESRFTLNGEFVATEEPQRVLETMLSACAGQLLYNNGKFSLFVGKGRTASGTITDDKILAPIQIQTKASGKDLVNGVKATYVRPDDKYIAGEITPYKDSTFLTEDTPTGKASADYENFLDLAFPYTQSTFTAQRLARIALNYERQDQTLSVLVPLDFLSHQVGDIVNLDNDRLGYSGKDFEIIGMSFEFLNDQYLALRLSLKEYSSTIFDFFTYVADPTLPSEPPSGDNTVGSPTGLSLAEFVKDSQVRLHFIRATWTNSVDDKIVTTEVAYKKSTDSNFDAADVSYPSTSFSFYVEPATTYNVKVRHITNTGVSSAYTGTVDLTTSGGQVTLTTGTISGITIESGKLYQGTGTFNNSNTGFYIDSTGQFSLKDKLSFNGTTLNISGNLTVENTITADKIVVGGITLDNLISASDQASSNYLTTFSGAVKIASGGASAGYPAELQIQATEHTNAIGTLQQSQSQLTIRARNNTSNGGIAFQGFNGTTPTNYGNFDASGNLNLNQNLVVSGDLTVSGTTTTVDTTNTNVKDNNLTLNYSTGNSSSTANGAGLTIQDAVSASTDATILWDATNDEFDFSHGINISGSSNFNNALTIQGTTTFNDDAIFVNDALFGDNDKAIFGAGSDLQIYHSSGNNFINAPVGGNLVLQANNVTARSVAQENMITAVANGAVTLHHDNSAKLATTLTGIDVTGIVEATANGLSEKHFTLVDSANTSITGAIYHDDGIMSIESGNNTAFGQIVFKRQATGGTAESARFDASGRLLVNKSSATGSLNLEVQAPSGFSVGSGFYSASTQSTIDFKDTNTTANYKVRIGSETDDLVMFAGGSKRLTINSSGNATFTGTISSGAITSSGVIESAVTGNAKLIADGSTHANVEIDRGSTSSHNNLLYRTAGAVKWRIWQDGADNILKVRNEVAGTNVLTFTDTNATFAGTISSGKIEGTTADADGHILKTDSSTASATDVVLQLRNSSADYNLGFRPRLPAGNMHAGVNADDFGIFTSSSKGISIGNNDKSLIVIHPTDGIEFHTNNTNRFNITTAGNFQLLGTTVIDASRNLANIGTYAGTGDITLTSGSNQLLFAVTNGALELTRGAGGAFIDFKDSTSDDFDSRIMGGNALIFSTGGNGATATALTLGSDQSATFASNIEGSLIKATDQFQSISGSRTLVMNANFSGLGAIGMSSNDHLTFVTNNTERMRLDNAGSLAVGNTSPSSFWGQANKLVLDASGNTGMTIKSTSSGNGRIVFTDTTSSTAGLNDGGQIHYGHSADDMKFRTAGADRVTINATGVGIGTTSPSKSLHIFASADTAMRLQNSTTGTGTTDGFLLEQGGNDSLLVNYEAGNMRFFTSGTESLRIDSSGRVGINTNSPDEKLDVEGNLRLESSSSNGTYLALRNSATNGRNFRIGSNFVSGAGELAIYDDTAGAERLRIDSSGNVGVGTTSPSSALHVKGGSTSTPSDFSAFISNATFRSVVNHSNEYGLYMGYANSSTDACAIQAGRSNGTTDPLLLNPYGDNVGIGTNSPDSNLEVSSSGVSTVKISGNYPRLFFEDTAGSDIDAYIVNNANGLFFGKTNSPTSTNDIMALDLTNKSITVAGNEFILGSSSVQSRIRTINSSGFTETAFDNFSSGAYQERMRISSSGSVGIAKTNPSANYKLDVNGKIRSQQEILINTGSLFINEEGEGIHIVSANGTEYKLTVSNAGALVITEQ